MAERKARFDKVCKVCGEPFVARTPIAMYCPECRNEWNIKKLKVKSEKQIQKELKAERKARQKNMKAIVSISNKARAENLSYGEYVVRKGI